ncbi:MAG: VTT domain-containing protein [Alphaproteobacteria bacterium]|nr:VTT domain-containing protein [Rhodospirillales bacterium]MCW9045427.1 VTT domain-containing protein [Alphaproteobacteria bacterium]
MSDNAPVADGSGNGETKIWPYIKGILTIGILVAVGYGVKASGLADNFDQAWIDAEIKGRGLWGYGLFFIVGALFTAVGLPRQIVSFMAGYAFGVALGTIIGVLATAGGCILSFYYARLFGREMVINRWPNAIKKVDNFLAAGPFLMAVFIRLLPVGSNVLTNLAAGVTQVNAFSFISGSALGYIPQMLVFALVGKGVKVDTEFRIVISVALFVVSGVIGAYLYRRVRRGKV